MNAKAQIDFEHLPSDGPLDETDVNLRAYLCAAFRRAPGPIRPGLDR